MLEQDGLCSIFVYYTVRTGFNRVNEMNRRYGTRTMRKNGNLAIILAKYVHGNGPIKRHRKNESGLETICGWRILNKLGL